MDDLDSREPECRFFDGKGLVRRGEITQADRELVAEAVAAGRVTKLPPGKARGDWCFDGRGDLIGHERENKFITSKRKRDAHLKQARAKR